MSSDLSRAELSKLATASALTPAHGAHDHQLSAVKSTTPAERFGNFDLVKRFELDYANTIVSRWQSRLTGLTVVHLDYEAPIVEGYFPVRTEIFNDSGCPHTLEHLIFMGSKKYPYKGIIDHLANRGFSNGTNAWTADDHTCYTVSTAGSQGFLQILPIYIDHIINPTLNQAAFVTEVHHISPNGQDSGVVYSEMQGRENTAADRMFLSLKRSIFPEGSGYRSETGGLMEALRRLDVFQIREYHGQYYVPHNLAIFVAGKLSGGTNSLLSVLQEQVEPGLIAQGYNKGRRPAGWVRPFVESKSAEPPTIQTNTVVVEFPEKDESLGEHILAWKGPAPNNFLEIQALGVFACYLSASRIAPLNKEFIEIDKPYCTSIYFSVDEHVTFSLLNVYLDGVPTEHLETMPEKFIDALRRIIREGVDMERLRSVIDREQRQSRSDLESQKGEVLSNDVILDFNRGPEDGSEMQTSLDSMKRYDVLRGWTNKQWTGLLSYYVDAPMVVIAGKPSAALADKLEADEKARVAKQRERLGPDGLKRCAKMLEDAKNENERPIPKEILTSFPVPDVKSISWIPVQSVQRSIMMTGTGRSEHKMEKLNGIVSTNDRSGNSELEKHIAKDSSTFPFFVEFDHAETDFVTVRALITLANLPDRLRPFINVYLSSLFCLPVTRASGERLAYEDVVARLEEDTAQYSAVLGVENRYCDQMHICIKAEKEKYETAVQWLYDIIYGSEFDLERIQVSCAKVQQMLPQLKRDGTTVMHAFALELLHDESSNERACSLLSCMKAIPDIKRRLTEEPDSVRKDFEELKQCLTRPGAMRLGVNGNIIGVPNPARALAQCFKSVPSMPPEPFRFSYKSLSVLGRNPQKKALVVNLPTVESSFIKRTAKSLQGITHADFPALRLGLEVLNATESYLWQYIRGSGLAYGAYISCDVEAGLINFYLLRCSNTLEAIEEGAKVVHGLVDGSIELKDTSLDAAKSTIVYTYASSVASPGTATFNAFENQAIKGVAQDYHHELLEKYQAVSIADVRAALSKYVLPLFNAASSIVVVATAPGKVDETVTGLEKLGFEVESRTLTVSPEEMSTLEEEDEESSEGSGSEKDGS